MTRLSVIGAGAFGRFMTSHLRAHFELCVHDPAVDLSWLGEQHGVLNVSFEEAATADTVVLATPIDAIADIATRLAPLLRAEALVVDVCSVKVGPLAVLDEILPRSCAIVGTHPLFGPNSSASGIAGRRISVCDVRGGRGDCVTAFLRDRLGLEVIATTPEEHDRALAQVQGLTHLITRILREMNLPDPVQTTAAYDHLSSMVDIVSGVSDDLSRAIAENNPFVDEIHRRFFESATQIEQGLRKRRD